MLTGNPSCLSQWLLSNISKVVATNTWVTRMGTPITKVLISIKWHDSSSCLLACSKVVLEKNTFRRFSCTRYWVVKYDIHSNSSNLTKYLNLASTKFAILMMWISHILRFANEFLNLARSSLFRKLASKVVGVGACGCAYGGVYGGMHGGAWGGSKAWDDSLCFKYPDIICFGVGGPSEDIGNQKKPSRPKFTQAKVLWRLSSNTWHAMKIG